MRFPFLVILMIAFLDIGEQSKPEIQKIPPGGPSSQIVAVPSGAEYEKLKKEYQEILDEHNRVRADVGVGPLKWSNSLASYAQEWAEHLARAGCRIQHRPPSESGNHQYGENLFAGTAGYYGMIDAVRSWESEKQQYSGGPISPSNFMKTGHYTRMVWRDTTHVGCGTVTCQGQLIVVCNYDPPGNIIGNKPLTLWGSPHFSLLAPTTPRSRSLPTPVPRRSHMFQTKNPPAAKATINPDLQNTGRAFTGYLSNLEQQKKRSGGDRDRKPMQIGLR